MLKLSFSGPRLGGSEDNFNKEQACMPVRTTREVVDHINSLIKGKTVCIENMPVRFGDSSFSVRVQHKPELAVGRSISISIISADEVVNLEAVQVLLHTKYGELIDVESLTKSVRKIEHWCLFSGIPKYDFEFQFELRERQPQT